MAVQSENHDSLPVWSVYMLRCGDGSLYTGIATDVDRRVKEHDSARGKGAKYLRGRRPFRIVCRKTVGELGVALKVERRIKTLSRARKEILLTCADAMEAVVAEARRADETM